MAKVTTLKREKDLGQVTKILSNGMYMTSKEFIVPPYPGIEIGDKLKTDSDGRLVMPEKEQPTIGKDDTVSRAEFEALKKQNEQLAQLLGEKGSDVKAPANNTKTTKKADSDA